MLLSDIYTCHKISRHIILHPPHPLRRFLPTVNIYGDSRGPVMGGGTPLRRFLPTVNIYGGAKPPHSLSNVVPVAGGRNPLTVDSYLRSIFTATPEDPVAGGRNPPPSILTYGQYLRRLPRTPSRGGGTPSGTPTLSPSPSPSPPPSTNNTS